MEFVLIKKICVRWLAGVLSLAILASCLSGCTLRDTSIWVEEITMQCDDPYVITTFYRDEKGIGHRETYMEINGVKQKVELGYRSTLFEVYVLDHSHRAECLILGTWRERKGNLVLYVEEDYVFGNHYETIILTPADTALP